MQSPIFQVRLSIKHNGGGMARKGLSAITSQVTRKVYVDYNPLNINKTLIGYSACVHPT
jgi:hypothetical protein